VGFERKLWLGSLPLDCGLAAEQQLKRQKVFAPMDGLDPHFSIAF